MLWCLLLHQSHKCGWNAHCVWWWLYKFVVSFVDLNYILNVPFYRLECQKEKISWKRMCKTKWKTVNGEKREENFLKSQESLFFLTFLRMRIQIILTYFFWYRLKKKKCFHSFALFSPITTFYKQSEGTNIWYIFLYDSWPFSTLYQCLWVKWNFQLIWITHKTKRMLSNFIVIV